MVKRGNFFQKLLKFNETNQDTKTVQIIHTKPTGSYGTESYSGYTSEDYLQKMKGSERADNFDKMRRGDPQIKMCLSAVKSPIKSATWEIQAADTEYGEEDKKLIEYILFDGMDNTFAQFLSEALTFVDFGHSVFEIIDRVMIDSERGNINALENMAWRSPRTIERWNLNKDTGKLQSISQYAYGDLQRLVDIPSEFLLVFSLDKEGANYEGISAIRPCYGNWFRKNEYLKYNAIGIEKHAIPTPIVEVPKGEEGGQGYENMVAALENFCVNEKNYITKPEGWNVILNNNSYDPQKVETSIDNEDKRMVKAFMANFLELGMNGFGSQSLSFDLSDFFLGAIDHIAIQLEETVNRVLIPRMIQLNRGKRSAYPKLKHSGIKDKSGKEIADVISAFVGSGVLRADDVLEAHLRKRFQLPESDLTSMRMPPQKQPQPQTASLSLIERVKALREKRNG